MKYNILFTYNVDPSGGENPRLVECSSTDTVDRIAQALQNTGNTVFKLNLLSPEDLKSCLRRLPPIDFVFNIAEGFLHIPRTMYDGSGPFAVKDYFNQLNIPVSHSGPRTMIKCRNKQMTNLALRRAGIPTPNGFVIYDRAGLDNLPALKFPLFVKPLSGGNSLGIDEGSVVESFSRLEARVNYLDHLLGGTGLLVEEYLPGAEYTVAVIGNNPLIVLPPLSFQSNQVRSTQIKQEGVAGASLVDCRDHPFYELADLAIKSFEALKAADVIRVDIKENSQGEKYVIDVNGTPSLGTGSSLYRSAGHLGLSYQEIVALILGCSLKRHGLPWGEKLSSMMADIKGNVERYYPSLLLTEEGEQVL